MRSVMDIRPPLLVYLRSPLFTHTKSRTYLSELQPIYLAHDNNSA